MGMTTKLTERPRTGGGNEASMDGQPCSPWYPLFEHMSREHELTLLDDELATIASLADKCRVEIAEKLAQNLKANL